MILYETILAVPTVLSDIPTLEELAEVTGQDIEQLRRDANAFSPPEEHTREDADRST